MISKYDVVELLRDIPKQDLLSGSRGVVLIVYHEPDLPRAYEVEFLDNQGNSIAIVTLHDKDLKKINTQISCWNG
jgi:hypothetical protein